MGYFFKGLNSAFQISQFANLIKRYVYKRDMIEICEPKLAFVTEPSPQILLVIQKGLFQFPNVWWNVLDSKVALETKLVRKWTLNFYRERNMTNKIRLLQEVWRAYYDHKSSLYLVFPVSYRIWITLEAEAVAWRCYVKKVLNLAWSNKFDSVRWKFWHVFVKSN